MISFKISFCYQNCIPWRRACNCRWFALAVLLNSLLMIIIDMETRSIMLFRTKNIYIYIHTHTHKNLYRLDKNTSHLNPTMQGDIKEATTTFSIFQCHCECHQTNFSLKMKREGEWGLKFFRTYRHPPSHWNF